MPDDTAYQPTRFERMFPTWAARRAQGRLNLEVAAFQSNQLQAATEATAGLNGHLKTAINKYAHITDPALNIIKDRENTQKDAAELSQLNGYASGIVEAMSSIVVGLRMIPRSVVDADAVGWTEEQAGEYQDGVAALFQSWAPQGDVNRARTFYDTQQIAFRGWWNRGESFHVRTHRRPTRRQPYQLRSKSIEPLTVKTPRDLRHRGDIRDGIQINTDGSPVAIYAKKGTNKDGKIVDRHRLADTSANFQRIPVFDRLGQPNLIHNYHCKEDGQVRGVPLLSPVIDRFQLIKNWDDAWAVRQGFLACIMLILQSPIEPNPVMKSLQTAMETIDPKEAAAAAQYGYRTGGIKPGGILGTGPAESVTAFNPGGGAEDYEKFLNAQLAGMTAGFGMPAPIIFPHLLENASFSAHKAMSIKAFKQILLFHYLASRTSQFFIEHLIEEAVLRRRESNVITLPHLTSSQYFKNPGAYTVAHWGTPNIGIADPTKEIDAMLTAVEGDLSNLEIAADSLGHYWKEILRGKKRTQEFKKKIKLDPEPGQAPAFKNQPQGIQDAATALVLLSAEMTRQSEGLPATRMNGNLSGNPPAKAVTPTPTHP